MGAWAHVSDRIETATRVINNEERRPVRAARCAAPPTERSPRRAAPQAYVGRRARASPAVGYGYRHKMEQDAILSTVFNE